MGQPTTALGTLRPDLGGSMLGFDNALNQAQFIGLDVLPVLEVAQQAGTYGKIPIESLNFTGDTRRAPKAGYKRAEYEFETETYATKEHGWEDVVDAREAKMWGNYFSAELISAIRARSIVLRNYEVRVAALIQATGTFTNAARTAALGTVATSTPIADVNTRKQAIYDATGIWPDTLVLTRKQAMLIPLTDEFNDKMVNVERTFAGDFTMSHFQAAFDLPKILVAGGAKNTANAGQTASLSTIWDDDIMAICKTGGGIVDPCLGHTMHWGEDGSAIGTAMESYESNEVRGNVIRARMDTDEHLKYPALCELITGVVT